MKPIQSGSPAPPIPGADFSPSPVVLFFYKVTCPTCHISAPVAERMAKAFPKRVIGVAQDPRDRVEAFEREYGTTFPSISDTEPYEASNAYGIRTVPTLFVIEEGSIADVVESWDRDAWNRVGGYLASRAGAVQEALSTEGDGLPPFRPG